MNLFKKLILASLVTSQVAVAAPTNAELKFGIAQEFENLNPLIMSMSATSIMFRLVGRTLVTLNGDNQWVTQLAKDIPTFENKKAEMVGTGDKKYIKATWEILENAQWGDGTPITCGDFAFALKVASSPNVAIAEKETFTLVKSIEAIGGNQKKCLFTYEQAKWDFNRLGQFYPLPKHLEEPIFNKYGSQKEGYEKNSTYVKNPTNPGLFNGPYKISEVKLGSHVTFVPNAKFYGQQPKIQKIVFKLIPNTGTLEANLRSGTIDAISSLGLGLDQAIVFDKKIKSEKLPYEILFKPSVTYEHIDLNLDNPFLQDVRVRKALMFSYNREDLVKALFEGKQQAAIHSVTPNDPWFTADPQKVNLYRYSKREAQKLLDEAGWKMEKDGFRYKDGKKLEFTLMTTAGNKSRELVQVYLKEQWKQVGIDITIKNEPARVYFGETTSKRKFPAMALFAWVSSPENNPKSTFHSKNIPTDKNGWSGQNFMGWKNAKVDALTDAIDLEFDAKKRKDMMADVLKEYTNDVPVLPLFYRSDVAVIPTNLKNYKLTGHQFPETNQVEYWDLGAAVK